MQRLLAYAEAPNAPHHDVLFLVGRSEGFRLRPATGVWYSTSPMKRWKCYESAIGERCIDER